MHNFVNNFFYIPIFIIKKKTPIFLKAWNEELKNHNVTGRKVKVPTSIHLSVYFDKHLDDLLVDFHLVNGKVKGLTNERNKLF